MRMRRDSNSRCLLGTHAFQACALDHSATCPNSFRLLTTSRVQRTLIFRQLTAGVQAGSSENINPRCFSRTLRIQPILGGAEFRFDVGLAVLQGLEPQLKTVQLDGGSIDVAPRLGVL